MFIHELPIGCLKNPIGTVRGRCYPHFICRNWGLHRGEPCPQPTSGTLPTQGDRLIAGPLLLCPTKKPRVRLTQGNSTVRGRQSGPKPAPWHKEFHKVRKGRLWDVIEMTHFGEGLKFPGLSLPRADFSWQQPSWHEASGQQPARSCRCLAGRDGVQPGLSWSQHLNLK